MEENNENVQLSEKEARKKRLRERRMARRAKHNARIARCRLLKNIFIWFLGVIFLPIALVGVSFVVPISVITGNNGEYVSEDLSNKSLFEAVKFVAGNYSELGFSDFPIIGQKLAELENTDIGDGKTLGNVVDIDTDKLNAIKFGEEGMADKIRGCVEVIATLDSVGGTDMLGDFGTLNVFNDAEEVGTLASIDTTAADFDAKQYYYKTAGDEYLRAFNDDGTFADGLNGSETVYYPPLAKVRISELVNIMDDAFGRVEINSLLDTFGASNETLAQILGEHTKVKDLSDFDNIINGVALKVVLPYEGNTEIYDILRSATNKTDNDDITIGLLKDGGFQIDNITLTSVLPDKDEYNNPKNEEIYKILRGALSVENNSDITIEKLTTPGAFEITNIKLETVIGSYDTVNEDTQKLYDVLSSALGGKEISEITISDLTSDDFDIYKVKLIDILDLDDDTYDILCAAAVVGDGESQPTKNTITIGHLRGMDIYSTPLDTVLTLEEDSILNKVLNSAVVNKSGESGEILLKDLTSSNFHINDVKLYDVLDLNESSMLKKILDSAVDLTGTGRDYIILGDLTGNRFNINNVALYDVLDLDEDSTLKRILDSAVDLTGTGRDYIVFGDLTGDNFNINNVALYDVLDLNEDSTLKKILDSAIDLTGTGRDYIVLGDLIGDNFDINNVKLYDVLDLDEDSTLKKILDSAVDLTGSGRDYIVLGDLTTGFNINSVPLDTVLTLDENSTLNKILKAAVNGTGTDGAILLGDLTTGFDINSVPLNTVLEGVDLTDNSVLSALKEQNIVISEIGSALNDLSLYEVYGKTAFVEIEAGTEVPLGARRFNRVDDVDGNPLYFEYDADGDYYLKNNSGIWLILCFDTAEYDTNDNVITRYKDGDGNPTRYIVDDMQIKDLQSGAGSGFSRKFKNATLKQLIDTGLVDDDTGLSNDVKSFSLQEIIAILADPRVQAIIATM